jgi:hypothetical protein
MLGKAGAGLAVRRIVRIRDQAWRASRSAASIQTGAIILPAVERR